MKGGMSPEEQFKITHTSAEFNEEILKSQAMLDKLKKKNSYKEEYNYEDEERGKVRGQVWPHPLINGCFVVTTQNEGQRFKLVKRPQSRWERARGLPGEGYDKKDVGMKPISGKIISGNKGQREALLKVNNPEWFGVISKIRTTEKGVGVGGNYVLVADSYSSSGKDAEPEVYMVSTYNLQIVGPPLKEPKSHERELDKKWLYSAESAHEVTEGSKDISQEFAKSRVKLQADKVARLEQQLSSSPQESDKINEKLQVEREKLEVMVTGKGRIEREAQRKSEEEERSKEIAAFNRAAKEFRQMFDMHKYANLAVQAKLSEESPGENTRAEEEKADLQFYELNLTPLEKKLRTLMNGLTKENLYRILKNHAIVTASTKTLNEQGERALAAEDRREAEVKVADLNAKLNRQEDLSGWYSPDDEERARVRREYTELNNKLRRWTDFLEDKDKEL